MAGEFGAGDCLLGAVVATERRQRAGGALERPARRDRRVGGDGLHVGHLAAAVEHDVAAGGEDARRALGMVAAQCIHRDVVAHQQPVETNLAADDPGDHLAGGGRRFVSVDGRVDDMRGHRHAKVAQRPERREIARAQIGDRRIDDGQGLVQIGEGTAVAGNVLHHRQDTASEQPVGRGAAKIGDGRRIAAIGAVADDVVGTLDRHVEHRQGIGGDAEALQVEGVKARHEESGAAARIAVAAIDGADLGGGRIGRCQRCLDTLHPPALLVDEDRGIRPSDAGAHGGGERPDFPGLADVAGEQDESPRPFGAEEVFFFRRQRLAGATEDHGL